LSSIFEERRPLILQSDNRLEFHNSEVRELLNQWKSRQVFSKSYTLTTQGLVEHFNQTLKIKIFNGFLQNNNKHWVDYLQDYVVDMNDSFQTTIKAKPSDMQAQALVINSGLQKEVRQCLINRNILETMHTPVFKRGQLVRIALSALTPYKRNHLSKPLLWWTNKIYHITKVLEVSPDQPWDLKRYIVNKEIYNRYQLQQVLALKKSDGCKTSIRSTRMDNQSSLCYQRKQHCKVCLETRLPRSGTLIIQEGTDMDQQSLRGSKTTLP